MAKLNDEEKKIFSKENFAKAFNRENVAKALFIACAAFSIIAVFAIVVFILEESVPAFSQTGFFKFIFGTEWSASNEVFGVWPMIVTSFVLTALATILGGVMAVFTAVFIVFYCPKWLKKVFIQIVNLLAGIPSIIFGYFGLQILKPLMQQMTGVISASGLLLSTIVLSIMILPTIASMTRNSLEAVPQSYYEGSLALGNTKNQTVFRVILPAAKKGIIAAMILGIGRAIGETMAVQFLLGGAVNYPSAWFLPIRSLTSNIVMEFGYATGVHRSALIATGFILLIFILLINIALWFVKRNNGVSGNKMFSRKLKESDNAETAAPAWKKSGLVSDIMMVLSYVISILVAAVLVIIVAYVLIKGLPNLSWHFLFGTSSYTDKTLLPSFITTGLIILISLVIALPLGIGAAIFLNEYARKGSKFVTVARLFIDTLAGVPSIIFGLFGAIFFCSVCNLGTSIIAGGLTMVLMILPTVIRSTEQSLSEVDDSMREASYALGAGKLRTVFKVVLPQALPGIITAIILSIGRIVGETAALIYTAGMSIFLPTSLSSQGSTFAVFIYSVLSENKSEQVGWGWGACAVLLIFVVLLNLLVAWVERTFQNKRDNKKGFIRRGIAKMKEKKLQGEISEK